MNIRLSFFIFKGDLIVERFFFIKMCESFVTDHRSLSVYHVLLHINVLLEIPFHLYSVSVENRLEMIRIEGNETFFL